jgi:AcrR family transcriptional regulator
MTTEQRRAQLLDCAVDVLSDSGFDHITVEAIAQRAGITRPVVYDTFGDLESLLVAVIERAETTALGALSAIVGSDPPPDSDPDRFLIDSIGAFLQAVRADPRTWRLVLMPPPGNSPELRKRIVAGRRQIADRLQALLDWGIPARGGPLGLDHELLARLLAAIGEDAARLMLAHPRRFSVERLTASASDLLGLVPHGQPPVSEPPAHPEIPPPAPLSAAAMGLPSSTDGRRRVPQTERREQLLDVALALIAEQGFGALSMEAIARRAGVNRVVIYRSFANLPVLVTALMHREDVRVRATLQGLIPQEPVDDAPELVLYNALAQLLRAASDRPVTWRLALLRPESAPRALQRIVNRRRAALARRIEPLVRRVIYDLRRNPPDYEVEAIARMLLTIGEEQGRLSLEDPAFPPARLLRATWQVLQAVSWQHGEADTEAVTDR